MMRLLQKIKQRLKRKEPEEPEEEDMHCALCRMYRMREPYDEPPVEGCVVPSYWNGLPSDYNCPQPDGDP
jgi:hypothetical protein